MAPAVRTNYDVLRWTAIQTLLALSLVLPATALGLLWLCGGNLSRSLSGYDMLPFGLALATLEALVFGPIVALRSSKTLRELTVAGDELDRLAHVDSLTGLLNRRGFDKVASEALVSTTALSRPAAALMCDLDHFKRINDRLGHEFGDMALRFVANILREAVGQRDAVIGRVGGEEFAILLTNVQRADALAFAEKIRRMTAERPVECGGAKTTITMSVGFAATPCWQGEVSSLLARADAALYEAKGRGRNHVAAAREGLAEVV